MRTLKSAFLCVASALFAGSALAQTPGMTMSYFVGTWIGKTNFANDKNLKDIGCSIQATGAVAGKYLQLDENLFIPGAPEETLIMLTYDPMTHLWEAWTFNQHTAGAQMTTGAMGSDANKIVLSSPGVIIHGENTAYRETLTIMKKNEFTLTYEIRNYDQQKHTDVWTVVYKSDYTRKSS